VSGVAAHLLIRRWYSHIISLTFNLNKKEKQVFLINIIEYVTIYCKKTILKEKSKHICNIVKIKIA
jgi:hypothetical protein